MGAHRHGIASALGLCTEDHALSVISQTTFERSA
jgi:hypothetical protein